MTVLDKKWFRNESNLSVQVTKSLIAPDLGRPINQVLARYGWQGTATAGVAVELSADNSRAARAQFFLKGRLSENAGNLAATKMWERADKAVAVTITFPSGEEFSFSNGTLASDYLQEEAVKIVCSKNGAPLLPAEYAAHGIGTFCLRAVTYLDKGSNTAAGPKMKYTILAFPHSEEEMMEQTALAEKACWPGVKILEGQAELMPALPQGEWGCPILPIIIPGTDPDSAAITVSGQELRFAVAKMMATARLPVPCASAASMAKKWAKLLQDPSTAEDRIPSITWPPAVRPQAAEGK